MKLITKNTDYAVRALLFMGSQKGLLVSARQIAQTQQIPYQFLRRILSALIEAKLVVSKEGVGGGFRLKTATGKIRLSDVMRVFQGEVVLSECMFRKKLCQNRKSCLLRRQIMRIEDKIRKEFDHITIGRLLK